MAGWMGCTTGLLRVSVWRAGCPLDRWASHKTPTRITRASRTSLTHGTLQPEPPPRPAPPRPAPPRPAPPRPTSPPMHGHMPPPPGLFIPVELLDYGLALLSTHCGWSTAHMLYVPVNTNTVGGFQVGGWIKVNSKMTWEA